MVGRPRDAHAVHPRAAGHTKAARVAISSWPPARRLPRIDIRWLGEPDCHDPREVGAKAANLSRLAARHRVPPGFCFPAAIFDDGPAAPAIGETVAGAYALLAARCGTDAPAVAVRSSGIDEDTAASSFAGQHDTILDVRGARAVTDAVLAVRDSARSERARAYRAGQGISGDARIAVLVQQLVVADVAIVAFGIDPVRADRDRIVVNASWGLGESIVSGSVTPDAYVVRRSDQQIVERSLGSKERMTVAARDGAREVAVPTLLRERAALSDHEILAVATLVQQLGSELRYPVDIEAAFAAGDLYLLQCRPVTTLNAWTVGA